MFVESPEIVRSMTENYADRSRLLGEIAVSDLDVGDLTIDLYGSLISEHRYRLDQWFGDPWVQTERNAVQARIRDRSVLPEDWVERLRSSQRGEFALLLGLDDAFMTVHPKFDTWDHGTMTATWTRYGLDGRYNADESAGLVLPRFAYPARPLVSPESVSGYLRNVVCVLPAESSRARYRHLDSTLDLPADVHLDWLSIGCVPFVSAVEEMDLSTSESPARYRVQVRDCAEVHERVALVLKHMDATGVIIGFLPEATLTAETLEVWRNLVRRTARPAGGRLEWILTGTGPLGGSTPPANRAVMIHRLTGEVVMSQDKMHPFTFDANQLAEWNLQPFLGHDTTSEDLLEGSELTIVSGRLGRVAIVICEDLDRAADLVPTIRAFNVSHVFTPIFAKEIGLISWQYGAAASLTREAGTSVFVSNSLVVPRLKVEVGPVRTSMAVWVEDESYNSWGVGFQHGYAERAHDVYVLVAPSGTNAFPTALDRRRSSVIDVDEVRRVGGDRRMSRQGGPRQ
jgi:hypothetical protein